MIFLPPIRNSISSTDYIATVFPMEKYIDQICHDLAKQHTMVSNEKEDQTPNVDVLLK